MAIESPRTGEAPKRGALSRFAHNLKDNFWLDSTVVIRKNASNVLNRRAVTLLIDDHGFDMRVWAVAASGFFTDSYNLFATNVILPSLGYIYWEGVVDGKPELKINVVTLGGSMFGALLCGYLADRLGRRKLYGMELIVVIFGTLGVVQASAGFDGSMDIMGWLIFWRFFMGAGIGAEYPISAVITAEFAPKAWRARMMAAVFLVQSLGQLVAAIVNLLVLFAIGSKHGLQDLPYNDSSSKRWIDSIWRTVIGVGVFPALVAILFRLTIPESPRFTLDVDHDGQRALKVTQEYYDGHNAPSQNPYGRGGPLEMSGGLNEDDGLSNSQAPGFSRGQVNEESSPQHDSEDEEEDQEEDDEEESESETSSNADPNDVPKAFSQDELYDYFITQGSWRFLAATSACWFLLDFAFYGLGINNPRQIARIWVPQSLSGAAIPDWQTTDPTKNIYHVLKADAIQYIITISIGSVIGSVLLIKFIDYFPRKALLTWSFILLAGLFAIVGGSLFAVEYTNLHALTIALYVLCQLVFNLGPNALTFIIPAEIFPTRYRCTCHGISAAAGKLGSIAVQLLVSRQEFSSPKPRNLAVILLIFSTFMAAGAFISWIWLPDMQDPRSLGVKKSPAALENGHNGQATGGMEPESDAGSEAGRSGVNADPPNEEEATEEVGMARFKIPNKSLEELAEGYHAIAARQSLGFRRSLGLYDILQPTVVRIQARLSSIFAKKESKEE
ncbi:hypothetical protein G7Y89_g7029 [Cudoniella acicularis]|uniref:Major facilitator superfamily (MFS) profile domain-containing protein n=1 Tax=Cudoniella acicularis TaxID=354080 RepID=A0A8H4W2G7_9HELO|nr:hypothetical protein G7Y89_g7029 [Cudoniella acicularis]